MNAARITALARDVALGQAWHPQAVFTRGLTAFTRADLPIFTAADALDTFEALAGRIEATPFMLRVYPGFPDGTVQLHLPGDRADPDRIRALVTAVREAFGLTPGECLWQRGDPIGDARPEAAISQETTDA